MSDEEVANAVDHFAEIKDKFTHDELRFLAWLIYEHLDGDACVEVVE